MTRRPGEGWEDYAGYCSLCQKKTYWNRRQARSAARAIGKHLSAYPCGPFWHIGNLPTAIIRGQVTRDEFRDQVKAARKPQAS